MEEIVSQQYPVQISTLSCLNAVELARMAKTSTGFRDIVESFTKRTYDIEKLLLHFLHDPQSFRRMQKKTGAIISGSFAFRFFTRRDVTKISIDLFVGSNFKDQAGEWLLSNGFVYRPAIIEYLTYKTKQSSSYSEAISCPGFRVNGRIGVVDALDFVRVVDGVERKLVLHVTRVCPIQTILRFPFTCLMNFITYERAYCLYPVEMLEKLTSLFLIENCPEISLLMFKYVNMGICFFKVAYDDEFRHKEMRWVEDSHTLCVVLPELNLLDEEDKEKPEDDEDDTEIETDPIRLTSWSICTAPGDSHRIHFRTMRYTEDKEVYPLVICSFKLQKMVDMAAIFKSVGRRHLTRLSEEHLINSNAQRKLRIMYDMYVSGNWLDPGPKQYFP